MPAGFAAMIVGRNRRTSLVISLLGLVQSAAPSAGFPGSQTVLSTFKPPADADEKW